MPEAKLMGDILNKNTLMCNIKESLAVGVQVAEWSMYDKEISYKSKSSLFPI